jgi:XTP/dITP diphosphohydrolase
MSKLLLATTNRGKINEYLSLLKGIPFELVTPVEEGIHIDVEENYDSMVENATHKAVTFANASGLIALADDSGLEVDALGGEPGVRSARYAGEGASDSQRIEFLLDKMKDIPEENRSAYFKCVIAIALPSGNAEICSGECRGIISFEPRGDNGFGYDPVFFIPGLDKTMAELIPEVKNKISHRALAAQKAYRVLEQIAEKSIS